MTEALKIPHFGYDDEVMAFYFYTVDIEHTIALWFTLAALSV